MTDQSMARRVALSIAAAALSLMFTHSANADPLAEVQGVGDAFSKAFAACDIPAIMDLYEDNAVVIWPGQGEFVVGKPAFEKIVKSYCSGAAKSPMKIVSSDARQVGQDYIIHFGQMDNTTQGPDGKPVTQRIRTDELLHKSGGKWRYVVDHASVGLAPPPSAESSKAP
jgi:uncharacterized protein (TIGR02246 family)